MNRRKRKCPFPAKIMRMVSQSPEENTYTETVRKVGSVYQELEVSIPYMAHHKTSLSSNTLASLAKVETSMTALHLASRGVHTMQQLNSIPKLSLAQELLNGNKFNSIATSITGIRPGYEAMINKLQLFDKFSSIRPTLNTLDNIHSIVRFQNSPTVNYLSSLHKDLAFKVAIGGLDSKVFAASLGALNHQSKIYNLGVTASQLINKTKWANLNLGLYGNRYDISNLYTNLGRLNKSYNSLLSTWYGKGNFLDKYPSGIYHAPAVEFYRTTKALEVLSEDEEIAEVVESPIIGEIDVSFDVTSALDSVNRGLVRAWHGAVSVINSNNPDKTRHFSVSARELLKRLLTELAPDKCIYEWNPQPDIVGGVITDREKMRYITRNVAEGDFEKYIEQDITVTLSILKLLNGGTHELNREYSETQLNVLKVKIESTIKTLVYMHLSR